MSIIYDALKKVEGKVDAPGANPMNLKVEKLPAIRPKRKIKVYFLYVLVITLSMVIANIAFSLIMRSNKLFAKRVNESVKSLKNLTIPRAQELPKTLPASAVIPAAPTIPKKPAPPALTLNGIFFSEEEGYALINNQILRIGESIEGATVKRINENEVELEFDGAPIKLSTNNNPS